MPATNPGDKALPWGLMNPGLALLPTLIVSVALILFLSALLFSSSLLSSFSVIMCEHEWLVVVDVRVARSFELFAIPVHQIFTLNTCMIR